MIQAEITGVRELNARLRRLSEPLDNVARRIRVILHDQHTRRIKSEKTDPDGKPWAALAESTLAKKRGSMLLETGALLGSMQSSVSGLTVTENNVGTSYAGYHQSGTRNMPARPFMGIGRSGQDEIMDACVEMISRRLS